MRIEIAKASSGKSNLVDLAIYDGDKCVKIWRDRIYNLGLQSGVAWFDLPDTLSDIKNALESFPWDDDSIEDHYVRGMTMAPMFIS